MKRPRIWNSNSISPHILVQACSKHLFLEVFSVGNWTKDYCVLHTVLFGPIYTNYTNIRLELNDFKLEINYFQTTKIFSIFISTYKFWSELQLSSNVKSAFSSVPIKELCYRVWLPNTDCSRMLYNVFISSSNKTILVCTEWTYCYTASDGKQMAISHIAGHHFLIKKVCLFL